MKAALPTLRQLWPLRSLWARWVVVQLAGLVFAVAGIGWAYQIYSYEAIVSEAAKGGLATGNSIRALFDFKNGDTLPEVQSLLLRLRGGVTGITEVLVTDHQGRILAHSDPERVGAWANEPEVREAIASGRDLFTQHAEGVDPSRPNAGPQQAHLLVTLPIHGLYDPARRSAIIGAVVLDIDLASAGAQIARGFRVMALVLIGLLLASAATQFISLNAGYRRLLAIGRAATAFGRGQYGVRLDVRGPVEFERVERAFNDMANHVETADAVLRVAKRNADIAAEAKARFLANMSHEIRTPLTGIIGYSDLALEDQSLSEQTRHQIELVFSASNSLRAIIDDILDLSKMESGNVDIVPTPISIAEIFDHCASMAEPMAAVKGLNLNKTLDSAIPRWLMGDGSRIQQIVLNLINNAIKFTERGSVDLTASLEGQVGDTVVVRFTVKDTGIGIAPDKLPGLFRRFQQADETITRRFGGTGLGLAISKALVTLMRGDIGVDSEVGKGSTFWFELTLPVAARPLAERMVAAPEATGRALKVLVADDSEMNADLATTLLRRLGHAADKANGGEAAVHACKNHLYDLVLMDIQMPHMDGMEATRKIRALNQHNSKMPIVAMTANVLPEQLRQYRAAGLTDHLPKPIDRNRLRFILAHVAARHVPPTPALPAADTTGFDRAVFDDVRTLLGTEKLFGYLNGVSETLAGDWSDSGEREQLMQRAHKLVTTAGQFGFMMLSTAASELETAILRKGDVGRALAAFNKARELAMPIVRRLIDEEGKAERPAANADAAPRAKHPATGAGARRATRGRAAPAQDGRR